MICIQAKLDPQAAAEALAETYSQLLNADVFINREGSDRVMRHRGLLLALVKADGTIVVFASVTELVPVARVA